VIDWRRFEDSVCGGAGGATALCPACDAALKGALDDAGFGLVLQGVRGNA
jgi:hypothetical protein